MLGEIGPIANLHCMFKMAISRQSIPKVTLHGNVICTSSCKHTVARYLRNIIISYVEETVIWYTRTCIQRINISSNYSTGSRVIYSTVKPPMITIFFLLITYHETMGRCILCDIFPQHEVKLFYQTPFWPLFDTLNTSIYMYMNIHWKTMKKNP
jgi:hypothetical protein